MIDLIQTIRNVKHNDILKSMVSFEFKNVTFGYKNEEIILENTNFKISNNGLTLLKGNNGTGKTTIFKLLTKFEQPRSGYVICTGNSIIGYSSAKGDDVNSYIKCNSFLSDCLGDLTTNYLSPVLDFLNLQKCKDQRMLELSSGQRKKLSIFRAFIKSQSCMFFDEPLSHLDISFQQIVVEQIIKMKETMNILIATHTDKFDSSASHIYEIKDKSINIVNID